MVNVAFKKSEKRVFVVRHALQIQSVTRCTVAKKSNELSENCVVLQGLKSVIQEECVLRAMRYFDMSCINLATIAGHYARINSRQGDYVIARFWKLV